jgi:hypothetical protein
MIIDKTEILGIYNRVFTFNQRKVIFVVLAFILLNLGVFSLPDHIIDFILEESGLIENAQLLAYIACALISWIYAKKMIWKGGWVGGIIFMVFALRELDVQKRFTIMSVTKTRFFISPEVTLTEKLISVAVLSAIAVIFIFFAKNNYGKLIKGLQSSEKWAISTCRGFVLIIISVLLDSTNRWLKDLGIVLTELGSLVIQFAEELVELAVPVFFLMALIQWRKLLLSRTVDE